jgi:hypothetical protein
MTNMTGSKLSIFSHPGKITDFHIGLVIILRPPYWPEKESRDDNQANMEMPMY